MNSKISTKTFGVASSGIVPVRIDSSDASEMLTQILLGETCRVTQEKKRWVRIKCDTDGYEGWVNRAQMDILNQEQYEKWIYHPDRLRSPYFNFFAKDKRSAVMVPVGSCIIRKGSTVMIPHGEYETTTKPVMLKKSGLIDTAMQFLGVPYLWGGRTDTGIDCSGFIQTIHLLHGYKLPRDSSDQYSFAKIKSKDIKDAERGDLIYFNTTGKKVNHVGLYLGDGGVLHASGTVRLSNICYDKRNEHVYPFDKRLADHIYGVQSGSLLRKLAKPDQIE